MRDYSFDECYREFRRGTLNAMLRLVVATGLGYPLAVSGAWSARWLALLVIGFSAPFGVVAAAIQQLVPGPMRAQAAALFLLVNNLLGLGLEPLATGWLTDWLSPDGRSLHVALAAALTSGSLAAVGWFAMGFRPYRKTHEILAADCSAAAPV